MTGAGESAGVGKLAVAVEEVSGLVGKDAGLAGEKAPGEVVELNGEEVAGDSAEGVVGVDGEEVAWEVIGLEAEDRAGAGTLV